MKVKCKVRDVLDGSMLEYTEDIKTMEDYVRVRASMVHTSKGYIKGYQIVKNGYITEKAYNLAPQILKFITSNMTLKEFHELYD